MPKLTDPNLHFPRHKINPPLVFGVLIVFLTVLLAIIGQQLAPHDPMQENYSLQTSKGIHSPPYRLFEVQGYPLGTDNFGRDTLSRILSGVRPTLIMALIVTSLRLLVGLMIGMLAGWSSGWVGRALERLISVSHSMPVLIVAVIVISAVGIQKGLWVFLLGLSINGWAEAAHLISDKTQQIKEQTYIEAAKSLGASNVRVLVAHVLPQILPMVWMLISYEIGSTLLVVSELGFLGYYIGGGVLIAIFDFQTVNTTGMPELGQILATSLNKLTEPTALLVTGSFIFFIILGFNLLGVGLRREFAFNRILRRNSIPFIQRIMNWLEFKFYNSLEIWFKLRKVRIGLIVISVLLISALVFLKFRPKALKVDSQFLSSQENISWSAEHGNAQGTRFVPFQGPSQGLILWQTRPAKEFVGGPVVSSDGTIIAVGIPETLYAFDPQGVLRWQIGLPVTPVGSPALDSDGQIYVVDRNGGLSAFSPEGMLIWHFTPVNGEPGSSGPVVSREGSIFYTRVTHIQAVSSSGESLWYTKIPDNVPDNAPRLDPAENLVISKAGLILLKEGSSLEVETFAQLDPMNFFSDPSFFVGADGVMYYRSGHGAISWDLENNKYTFGKKTSWNARDPETIFPLDAGVNGHSLLWLLYGNYFSLDEMIWLDLVAGNTYGSNTFNYQSSNLIGMDINDVTYLCGYKRTPRCLAFKPGQENPVWETSFPDGQAQEFEIFFQIWGALAPGRLYITTRDGYLYGLGDQ